MAEFRMGVLTTKALQLIALAQAGKTTIAFTNFQIGNGSWGDEPTMATLQAATALKSVKGTFPVSKAEYVNPATTKLQLVASNQSNTSGGYYVTEVGVFAKWTDGTDFLYAIYVTVADKADWFPAYNSITPSSITYDVPITVANAISVVVDTNGAGLVTMEDLIKLQGKVSDIQGYLGYSDNDIVGVEVDFTNKMFTRLGAAEGLSGGADFDKFNAFGGRRRCNLADDGTVNAYYGDEEYVEDGSNGQVMVEQPKFYYKVVPISLERKEKGYITRKVRYYVSDTPKSGFKVHPDFVVNGEELDYVYHSAFEGCLYDTSESAYILDDAQVADFTASTGDKLSSIAGAKPMSGLTQNATRPNVRKLATNRGDGWSQQTIQSYAASELLMLIEYATFNVQAVIGNGVVSITDDTTKSCSSLTGSTTLLGNASGRASTTTDYLGDEQTANGKTAISYRGEENLWGNIWKWIDGVNLQNPTTFADSDYAIGLYVADHDFADNTDAEPYESTGLFIPYHKWAYISAFCYSEAYDWMFAAGETKGNSTLPVGDCSQSDQTGWRVCLSGAGWNYGAGAGAFFLGWNYSSGSRHRYIGGRLVYRKKKAA